MLKKILFFIIVLLALLLLIKIFFAKEDTQGQITEFSGKTVLLKTQDDITVRADISEVEGNDAPIILLFHQAGYSRGEYREISPRLNELGFNTIAIDQRSGLEINGVENETFKEVKNTNKPTEYIDAMIDLSTALDYVKENYPAQKIILWGSSYSASLSLILAEKNQDIVSGVLAFSPGEYFEYEGKKIQEYSQSLNIPVFITSARNEYNSWEDIYEVIPFGNKESFLPTKKGVHGSGALWNNNKNNDEYWNAVKNFLMKFN